MKVMVAALPKPANNPNPHIRIESASSKASSIGSIECDFPAFLIRTGIMGTNSSLVNRNAPFY